MILGFKDHNENTVYVQDGYDAWEQIQQSIDERQPLRFSLIIVECKMPIIDGYQTIKRIRQMFSAIGIQRSEQPHVAAVTCMIEKEFIAKAYKNGID